VGFVENLLEKCKKIGAKIVVIACNTAGTVLDEKFLDKYKKQGLQIILIIKKSAEVLYNATPIINNEKHILVLGTKQTISSNKYFESLLNLHNSSNSKLFIYQYSPSRWEQEIENGINRSKIQDMVDEDFAKIRQEVGQDFAKISSVGLFCTHYPYFAKEIHKNLSFHTNIGSNITLIPQGDIFAQEVLNYFAGNIQVDERIKSYITGSTLAPIQNAINNIYQSFPVIFEKI
jgi:glutamate racemase